MKTAYFQTYFLKNKSTNFKTDITLNIYLFVRTLFVFLTHLRIINATTNRMVVKFSIFFPIVFTTVRTECLCNPVLLPPRTPTHIFTNFITMVDAMGRIAMPFIEPSWSFHDIHLLKCLWKHLLNTRPGAQISHLQVQRATWSYLWSG